uniref:hydroxymethylbilane synthase n=4 Tax=Rhodnius TaxID=13248 RepID=T1HIA9_RHOPR
MSEGKPVFKIGSRKSELALIQTNIVIDELKKIYPNYLYEIVTMTTTGDQILDKPLPKIGQKSLFTKELETALLNDEVDLLVHSLKDLPTVLPSGLALGAILEREDARDALLLHPKHRGLTLASLPENSIIGTSSLRRAAQLKRNFPKLTIKDIRGNLQTRLKKLNQGIYDGIILAVAGVHRMGWEDRISQVLLETDMLYAVGQGALAVECRKKDCPLFAGLYHVDTAFCCIAERSLLNTLGGGCSAPVAVHSRLETSDGRLYLTAAVWSLDGSETLQKTASTTVIKPDLQSGDDLSEISFCGVTVECLGKYHIRQAVKLGVDVANDLIEKGALKIIEDAKN